MTSPAGPKEQLAVGDLLVDAAQAEDGLVRLDWRGKSTARNPGAELSPFLARWFDLALARDARLELHFEELEHLNSSTISVVVQLLQRLRDEPLELTLRYRGEVSWQRLTFEALRVFGSPNGRLRIEPV